VISVIPAGQPDGSRGRSRIGKYVVTGRLGRGGMGMVYRGYDEVLEREVAIKTLTVEGTFDEESRRRFEIEAKAAARLQHPNILTVFELGEDRGVPFIAMELLPGADLETLLRSGEPLPLPEKLDIVVQVCRGLAFAHEHNIVHRDIKPSNVRLLDDGTVKIMDFGIAKLAGTTLTKSGMMVGTVNYMSPEQIRAQPLDGRSDVFSVGVILYELLAGRRPFAGGDPTQVLYKIVTEEPAPIGADLGDWATPLAGIVAKALAKDPAARFPGAAAMADEVSGVLAATQSRAAPLPADAQEAMNVARRLLKEGRVEESTRRLREVLDRHPESADARRALRAATRETARRQRPAQPETQAFPELEATFKSPPTQKQAETAMRPTVPRASLEPAPPVATKPSMALLAAAAGALLLAVVVGAALWRGRGTPPVEHAATPSAGARPALQGSAPPATVNVAISSDPAGASLSVDGRAAEGKTPLTLPLDPGAPHVVVISREDYAPQEVRLAAGAVPAQVKVTLEPAGPPGTVSVASAYPLDVVWKGKVLAKGQVSPKVSVPPGRQVLTLQSSAYLLKSNVTIEVKGGVESSVSAPALGRISIRATPDNCEVLIDGVFVDYPPILDRQVAAGERTVAFKWPDGTKREERTEVPTGGLVYVTGRKD
jgi:serine/threonine protein kinase